MAFNPCPCMSLQQASKVLAIIDVVITVLNMTLTVIGASDILENRPTKDEESRAIITIVVGGIVGILILMLAFKLYNSAKNKYYGGCKTWMWITLTLTIINFVTFVYITSMEKVEGTYLAGGIISVCYKLFEMLVVHAFMKEMLYQLNYGFGNPRVDMPVSHPIV